MNVMWSLIPYRSDGHAVSACLCTFAHLCLHGLRFNRLQLSDHAVHTCCSASELSAAEALVFGLMNAIHMLFT